MEELPVVVDEFVTKHYPSYQLKPTLAEGFRSAQIRTVIQGILNAKLTGKAYSATECGNIVRDISDEVIAQIKEKVNQPRFKYIAQVTLGQQTGAGCRYICKCCWDVEADSYVSSSFANTSLFCVCTVFGIYLY